jgi:hypothetical protein
LSIHAVWSAWGYFVVWSSHPEVLELYQGGITAVADVAQPDVQVTAVAGPYINYWHPWNATAFDLAVPGDASQVRWFNPAGGWVWPAQGPVSYFFPFAPLGAQQYHEDLLALFRADGALVAANGRFDQYTLTQTTALDTHLQHLPPAPLMWPPDLAAALPPPALPLPFGDRLALLAVELLTPRAAPGDVVQFVTYWQVLRADPAPLVAFVHLTTDGVDIWGQQDWLDVRMAGLQVADRFAQVHRVALRGDAPLGVYHLQLGLYGPDTQVRLLAANGRADRIWVGEVVVE